MVSKIMVLMLTACLLAGATPVLAQSVTYCADYSGPYGDTILTIPHYDIADYALLNAEVELTVSYSGTFAGENVDPALSCVYAFGMNPTLEVTDLSGNNQVGADDIAIAGELLVGETTNQPLGGFFWNNETIGWDNVVSFYNDQDLELTVPDYVLASLVQMQGTGEFTWALNMEAQVCVTYSYDIAVPTEEISFDAIKASYR